MPIAPALPFSGLAGLNFIDRTYDRQFATFNKSPDIEREVNYFLEKAADITNVDQLMGDRRVLQVVLGAFGLDEDIDKGAFVRKVIEEGTFSNEAFSNRLVEPAYREMASFLGFGDVGGTLVFETTRLNIADRFRERQFELAIGQVDLDLRLAMNFRREAERIVNSTASDENTWLRLVGSTRLRSVVEGALGLPSSFGQVDLDQQVAEIIDRADKRLDISSPKDLLNSEVMDDFIKQFMLNQQLVNGAVDSGAKGFAALTILQSSGFGTAASAGLFASNFG